MIYVKNINARIGIEFFKSNYCFDKMYERIKIVFPQLDTVK